MDVGGAYGAGRAGAAFDPLIFAQKPQVITRAVCLFLSFIIWMCVSLKGYIEDEDKEYCIYNKDDTACSYGKEVAVLALLASIGLIAGEYLFEQMSSVKSRKHYVLGDLGGSAFIAFLFFTLFWYLASAWSKAETPKGNEGTTSATLTVIFTFFSIFSWGGCAFLAFQRFQMGVDPAFASTFEADPSGGGQGYTSYPDGTEAAYQEPPFGQQQQQRPMGDFQAPAY
ncbi:hypothetical protein QAD02_017395 [Eretmocerus hayati]|uniref:Uncharacterized protein n=1 Tax=Eretmocerus hayati TaxID=131215 RepID=A0ACC2PEW5_9HYME|nr:hypothetical protein QAD02_017395 [Eretmocerus hayati]